jgi:hypothetical protein
MHDNGDSITQSNVSIKGQYDDCANVLDWRMAPANRFTLGIKSANYTGRLIKTMTINNAINVTQCDTFNNVAFLPSGVVKADIDTIVAAGGRFYGNSPKTFDTYG